MQHLFHKVTALDMIRLYLTPKDKDKDKDTGHSPSLEQAKGMPLPKEISLHVLFPVDHVVLGKSSRDRVLQFRRMLLSWD